MGLLIIVMAFLLPIIAKGKKTKESNSEKSFLFEEGNHFTDEDIAFLETMERDERD